MTSSCGIRRARATVPSVDPSSTRMSSSTQSRGMALIVFSSVRAALRAGMTTATLASRRAVGMAPEHRSDPFSRLGGIATGRWQGVKAWLASLDAERPAGFTRRPRMALTDEQERVVAGAVLAAKAGDDSALR